MSHIQVGSYQRIDPKGQRFLGERAQKDGVVAGDLKCMICGRYYSWSMFNRKKYAYENRWDFQRNEPKHCGKLHCYDYQARYEKHLAKMANDPSYYQEMSFKIWQRKEKEREEGATKLFGNLKEKGVIA